MSESAFARLLASSLPRLRYLERIGVAVRNQAGDFDVENETNKRLLASRGEFVEVMGSYVALRQH